MLSKTIEVHCQDVLEFHQVRNILASYASSPLGRTRALDLQPDSDSSFITRTIAQTSEFTDILSRRIRPPLAGMHDILPLFGTSHKSQPSFGPEQFLKICDTLRAAGALNRFFADLDLDTPHLKHLAGQLGCYDEIINAISRCIDNDKTVSDHASETLLNIRRTIGRLSAAIHSKLQQIISEPKLQGALANERFLTRHNRPVIAIHENYRSRIRGAILDRSNTGATLYIEPDALGELSNQLEDQLAEEKKEIARILWELTRLVTARRHDIIRTVKFLSIIDLTYAKARFSIAYNMSAPRISQRHLRLRTARHPLLMLLAANKHKTQRPGDPAVSAEVVPIDVTLGSDFDLLILTGPNTGGKTVALKTIGVLVLMAQAGMHIPAARDSELPVFSQVFADIGDEQSIAQSLSTFSSHVSQIIHILNHADQHSLVLLDELGAGTDPAEGAALGAAILNRLLESGSLAIATTHLGSLKNYAYTTAQAENASVAFDPETLAPTYELLIGQAGSSNALAICQRLGMTAEMIDHARSLLTDDNQQVTELINRVQATRTAAEHSRQKAEQLQAQAHQLKEDARKQMEHAEYEKAHALDEADQHIEQQMAVVRRIAADLAVQMQNAPRSLAERAQQYAQEFNDAADTTPLAQRRAQFIAEAHTGDAVYALPFRQQAHITRIRKKRKTITISLNGKEIELPFTQIAPPTSQSGLSHQ